MEFVIKFTKRLAVLIVALVFFVLGVIGLFLPFLQGILFLAVALILFSLLSPTIRMWMETHTRKYPKLHAMVVKIETYIRGIIGEI